MPSVLPRTLLLVWLAIAPVQTAAQDRGAVERQFRAWLEERLAARTGRL